LTPDLTFSFKKVYPTCLKFQNSVHFLDGDMLGKGLAILSLLPLVIIISSLSVFCVKRDLHTVVYGIGMILNGIVSTFFEKLILF
jgi:hypothetical protein